MKIDEARCKEIHRFVVAQPSKKLKGAQREAPIRDAVNALVDSIRLLKEKGYTWDEVAIVLRQFGVNSTGGTIRQYHAKAIKQAQAEHRSESLQHRLQRKRNQPSEGRYR